MVLNLPVSRSSVDAAGWAAEALVLPEDRALCRLRSNASLFCFSFFSLAVIRLTRGFEGSLLWDLPTLAVEIVGSEE